MTGEEEHHLKFHEKDEREADIERRAASTLVERVKTLFQADGLIAKGMAEFEELVSQAKTLGMANGVSSKTAAEVPREMRRDRSPDDSVRGSDQAHVNVNRFNFELSDKTIAIIALIFSVAALVWLERDRDRLQGTLAQERAAVRELLARDHETQMAELAAVKRKYDLLDSDWMQMNGYLAANGVHKDAGGFYVKDGKRLVKEQGHER